MYDATVGAGAFPDDEIRRAFRRLVRLVGQLEPHLHAGLNMSAIEVMALGELSCLRLKGCRNTSWRSCSAWRRVRSAGWLPTGATGLGVTRRDPANRRYFQLKLTDSGRASAERIGRDLQAHHQRILAGMTGEEQRSLLTGLAALSRVLDADLRPRTPS